MELPKLSPEQSEIAITSTKICIAKKSKADCSQRRSAHVLVKFLNYNLGKKIDDTAESLGGKFSI